MTYDEAISYIHSVSNFFCKPGLDRIKKLCAGLSNPQKELNFIHVTGTNGKGSVSSMLCSILCEAGYKVGLYTSPYIIEFNERMRVNGKNIPDAVLAAITEKVKAVAEKMTDKPTEFELITAIAFEYFKSENCDIVVLEVGMGGKLDATNIIDAPILSIITGISIDHTAFLGDTVEQIAREKAGIIKPGSVALYGGTDLLAKEVIEAESQNKQTKLYKTDYLSLSVSEMTLSGSLFSYKKRYNVHIGLLGAYQPRNAAIVLDAIDILKSRGIEISEDAIIRGLSAAVWPARFEIIRKDPTIIFDGAHNPQGVRAAVESIESYFPNKRLIIISGVLRDKDYQQIASSISRVAEEVFTITPSNPRALMGEDYAKIYADLGIKATPCKSVEEALTLAISIAKEKQTAVCCLGSLYTYGEVINAL